MPEPSAAESDMMWLSAHLFLPSLRATAIYDASADCVVNTVIAPLLDAWRSDERACGHFFIRFNELGPHLRLRLRVRTVHADAVSSWVAEQVRARAPDADIELWAPSAPAVTPLSPLASDDADGSARLLRALRWIAYEPEVERYGGPDAIAIAERVFTASSDLALTLLAGMEAVPRSARLGRALLAFLAMLRSFDDDRTAAAAAAQRYGAAYLHALDGGNASVGPMLARAFAGGFARQNDVLSRHVEEIWACLHDGETPLAVDAFVTAIAVEREALATLHANGRVIGRGRPTADWRECVACILPSYLHMANNRLGLTIAEEAYLAHLVHWSLVTRRSMITA